MPPSFEESLLAGAYLGGKPPAALLLRNDRRYYKAESTTASSCTRALPHGTPCRCEHTNSQALCRVSPSKTTAIIGVCSLRFDDARRRLVDVRRHSPPRPRPSMPPVR